MSLRTLTSHVTLLAVGLIRFVPMHGQILHSTSPRPSFAVASIRPSQPDEAPGGTTQADLYEAKATTVKELIRYAYGIQFDRELTGGPAWIGTDRFTIEAKPDEIDALALGKLPRDERDEQMRLRMQSLLADRFNLQVAFEQKELPVYMLVVGKGGLKCAPDSSPSAIANPARPHFGWSAAPAPPPPPPGYVPPSPDEIRARLQQPLHLRTKGWPFWLVVTMLSHQPELGGRVVIDKTGLDGSYDCEASWAREGSTAATAPTFFTAIQEQMGLKLQPDKAPVEILVVASIDPPSEN